MLAGATAAPGFWDWSFDPPLVLVVVFAILFWLGDRRTLTPARERGARRARSSVAICVSSQYIVLSAAIA